jgi:hypothetical protein
LDKNTIPLVPVYTVTSLLLSAIAVPFYYTALIFSGFYDSRVRNFLQFVTYLRDCSCCLLFFIRNIQIQENSFYFKSYLWCVLFCLAIQYCLLDATLRALTLIASAFFISESLYYNSSFICHCSRPGRSKVVYFAGLGGLFLGLSVFAHPTSIVFVPGFIAYCAFSMRCIRIRILVSFIVILGITLFFYGSSQLHDIWFLY